MEAVVIYLTVNELVCEGVVSGSSCQGLFMLDRLGLHWFPNSSLFKFLLCCLSLKWSKRLASDNDCICQNEVSGLI